MLKPTSSLCRRISTTLTDQFGVSITTLLVILVLAVHGNSCRQCNAVIGLVIILSTLYKMCAYTVYYCLLSLVYYLPILCAGEVANLEPRIFSVNKNISLPVNVLRVVNRVHIQ